MGGDELGLAAFVNYQFERRIGMYPAGFEDDGQMYVNTAYGDYPHYLPGTEVDEHKDRFTGWMLLSYQKPVEINSPLVKSDVKVVDESESGYMIELTEPVEARYLRYDHVYCTNRHLAISELRVFGSGKGAPPAPPAGFTVQRQADRRNADLSWTADPAATGYVIYRGIDPDHLNLSALMYDQAAYELRALNTDQPYYSLTTQDL